jgi:hypothetical protein
VNQSREPLPAPLVRRASVIVAVFATLVVVLAGCDRGDHDQTSSLFDAWPPPSGPPATAEGYVQVRPWASSEASGKAFGSLWLRETRDESTLQHGGGDAYKWAIRTCDAVRIHGQSPQAMVRAVRIGNSQDKVRFTEQDAKVVVTAALRALCPAQRAAPTWRQPLAPAS